MSLRCWVGKAKRAQHSTDGEHSASRLCPPYKSLTVRITTSV